MSYETVTLDIQDHIALLTLNRPERLNAFNPKMYEELAAASSAVSHDDDVRVMILTGAGRAFSAGADFQARFEAEIDQHEAGESNITHKLPQYPNGFTDLTAIRQPVIAAINGYAIGVGFNFTLQCDIRLMAESARVRLPFTSLGMTPEAYSTYYLPRLIGLGKAFEIWYTSRWVEAEEAGAIGLVNEVVPDDELLPRAHALAEMIAGNAPTAVMMTKRLGYLGASSDLSAAKHFETFSQDYAYSRKDFKEAVTARAEKRSPKFTGE